VFTLLPNKREADSPQRRLREDERLCRHSSQRRQQVAGLPQLQQEGATSVCGVRRSQMYAGEKEGGTGSDNIRLLTPQGV